MKSFENLKLSSQLYDTIKYLGFTIPTEIQEKTIPLILDGKDVIGESATGSGKTLAFGCGIIDTVIPKKGLQSLILTPTRELAEQVKNSITDLAGKKNLRIISVYGGVGMEPQIRGLERAEVVIGTPGRILDHLRRGTINLGKIKLLVLDEADRMLDMGFRDDVEKIISHCNEKRQTLFFSATISYEIENLINKYMNNPISVSAVKHVDPKKLKQIYYDVSKNMKLALLVYLLDKEKSGLVMVFSNTRRNTDFIVLNLKRNGIEAVAVHGGLTQNKRTKTMELFHGNKSHVLVCTDVASRGLHIDNVSHIYNYDLPNDTKDYVHRIGRTARAGEEGKVINLVCKFDYNSFSDIRQKYPDFKIDGSELPKLPRIDIKVTDSRRSPRRGFQGGRGSWDKPKREGRSWDRGKEERSRDGFHGSKKKHWDKRKSEDSGKRHSQEGFHGKSGKYGRNKKRR